MLPLDATVFIEATSGTVSISGATSNSVGLASLDVSSLEDSVTLDGTFGHQGPTLVTASRAYVGGTWVPGHSLDLYANTFLLSEATLPDVTTMAFTTLESGADFLLTACQTTIDNLTIIAGAVIFDLGVPGSCVTSDSITVLGDLVLEADAQRSAGGLGLGATITLNDAGGTGLPTDVYELFAVGGSTTGVFSNAMEGDMVSIRGQSLDFTYVYAGQSIALVGQLAPGVDDVYSTTATTLSVLAPGVLVNDRVPTDPTLTVVLASAPTFGTVTLQPDGGFFFDSLGADGVAVFTYQIVDGPQLSPAITVSITVTIVAPSPAPSISPSNSAPPTQSRTQSPAPTVTRSPTKSHSSSRSPTASNGPVPTTSSPSPSPSRSPVAPDDVLPPGQPGALTPTPSVTPAPGASATRSPTPGPADLTGYYQQTVEDLPVTVTAVGKEPQGPQPVINSSGEEVATVAIPPVEDSVLVIAGPSSEVIVIPQVSSTVLDITVFNSNGEQVTSFDEDVEICFTADGVDSDDVCLGFFNDKGKWECEDFCLDDSDGKVCGGSRHLTNFALLLSDEAGSSSRCGSTSADYLYAYLSVAFVGAAICIVILAIVVIEVRIRNVTKSTDRRLTQKLEDKPTSASTGRESTYSGFVEPSFE